MITQRLDFRFIMKIHFDGSHDCKSQKACSIKLTSKLNGVK